MKRNVMMLGAGLLGLVLSAAAFAAPAANAPTGEHQRGSADAAALGLTGTLATQWDDINRQMRQLRQEQRASGKQEFDTTTAALSQSNPDVDALIKAHDARVDSYTAKRRALRDQRLALYHQMTPQQQAAARDVLLDRMEKMSARGQQKREQWQQKRAGAAADGQPSGN